MKALKEMINKIEVEQQGISKLEGAANYVDRGDVTVTLDHTGSPYQSTLPLKGHERIQLKELFKTFAVNRQKSIKPDVEKLALLSELMDK